MVKPAKRTRIKKSESRPGAHRRERASFVPLAGTRETTSGLKKAFAEFCQRRRINPVQFLTSEEMGDRISRAREDKYRIMVGKNMREVSKAEFYRILIGQRFGKLALAEFERLLKPKKPEKAKKPQAMPQKGEFVIMHKWRKKFVLSGKIRKIRLLGKLAAAGLVKGKERSVIIFLPAKGKKAPALLYNISRQLLTGPQQAGIHYSIYDYINAKKTSPSEKTATQQQKEIISVWKSF